MDSSRLITVFRQLALEAGSRIMEIYRATEVGIQFKPDASPVTLADRMADVIIAAGLRAAFPELPLVTEEQAGTHAVQASTFLIVDPLDGTKEFIRHGRDFTVNIAYVQQGIPRLGVIYAPAWKRLFYTQPDGKAVEEAGPFNRNTLGRVTPLRVNAAPDNTALRVVASKSHRDMTTDEYVGLYTGASLRTGSSLKFCLVAAGEADFYPRLTSIMEWDTAAGDAILRGAGGEVLRLDDHHPLSYGKPGWRNPPFLALAPGVVIR